jgi:hypothetical protein
MRRTNFNPDQVSVTAQTLTSTSPALRPVSLTPRSFNFVTAPELFFRQHAHTMPVGLSNGTTLRSSVARSSGDSPKIITKSNGPVGARTSSHSVSTLCNSALTFPGALEKYTRIRGRTPSFFARGLLEYPDIDTRTTGDALSSLKRSTSGPERGTTASEAGVAPRRHRSARERWLQRQCTLECRSAEIDDPWETIDGLVDHSDADSALGQGRGHHECYQLGPVAKAMGGKLSSPADGRESESRRGGLGG